VNDKADKAAKPELSYRESLEKLHIDDKKIAGLLWTDKAAWDMFKIIVKGIYGLRCVIVRYDDDNKHQFDTDQITLRIDGEIDGGKKFDLGWVLENFKRWLELDSDKSPELPKRSYDRLNVHHKEVVDTAWNEVCRVFAENDFKAANDDRAEDLVDAITKYLKESNK
jgi:hypothetical protein